MNREILIRARAAAAQMLDMLRLLVGVSALWVLMLTWLLAILWLVEKLMTGGNR